MCATIKTKNGYIHYWFDASFDENLSKNISKSQKERECVTEKLQQLNPNASIEHEQSGAPILKNADYPCVSISHYKGWFGLFFSTSPCGVDIQPYKTNMLKGKHYFINDKEEELMLSTVNLHLIWAAKEAFFKKLKGEITDLKNEVSIIEIDDKNKVLTLIYNEKKEKLNFKIESKFIIVWT